MTEAPKQFKQPSRKGKKAWRKNVDISEVQEGLETVRDEITKGGIVAEKPSSELFTLDPTGDQRIQRAYNKIHKPLKADEILAQRSAVPPIDSRKRPTSRTTDGVLESSNKRRRSGVVSHKELERLKKLAYGGEHVYKDVVAYTDAPEYDPWAENQNPLMGEMESRFSFLEAKKPVREPKTLKRAPVSLAADGKAIPAVQKPKPEASYNPQSTDYFEAYIREGEKAVEEEKKRLRAAEEERERLERAAKSGAEVEVKEKELSDENENEASEWEGIQSEVESSAGSHKRPERKTRAQRNKIARRKEAERKAAWEAAMKKRAQQAAQIKTIARSIEEKERVKSTIAIIASTTAAEEEDQEGETAVQLRKRRFGKAPIPQETLELVLPDELQDSLRLLKPEGNLLRDRFRSALLRGKIENRKPVVQHKKARTTITEKWGYKDWRLVA